MESTEKAYCDKFLRNTPRNLIWNNIDYILYNVVRRAITTRFDLAQRSHQARALTNSKMEELAILTARVRSALWID